MVEIKIAGVSDIDGTLTLHYKYQIDSIREEDKKDGFVTTPFTVEQLERLIAREQGLFIAKAQENIVAYAMAASWDFWSEWPMFTHMMNDLPNLTYLGHTLSRSNTFQYGPICVDRKYRGTGVLQKLFGFMKSVMAEKYPILVTFINKNNPRSYRAHTRKLGLEVIQEFEYNHNTYYELACKTGPSST